MTITTPLCWWYVILLHRIDIVYSCTKSDDFRFSSSSDIIGAPKFCNGSHDLTMPQSGTVCRPQTGTCYDQHVHQFEVSSLNRSSLQRYLKGTKSLKWVTWSGHTHFMYILSSVGWDLLCTTHILSLKCPRLPATKKWRAKPNVKIVVLSHPLGDLGVTYTVHLWLVGKRVVDFLLALIELFSLALTV